MKFSLLVYIANLFLVKVFKDVCITSLLTAGKFSLIILNFSLRISVRTCPSSLEHRCHSKSLEQCLTNLCRSKSCQKEVYSSSIDRCLIDPCEKNEQCVNVYPNNYLCICRNCSLGMKKCLDERDMHRSWVLDRRYPVGFHWNSYIKHLPLKSMEHTGRFQIEIWFLSESSSGRIRPSLRLSIELFVCIGLLIYSEHINSKKGHMKLFIERKMIIFNLIVGSQTISLR